MHARDHRWDRRVSAGTGEQRVSLHYYSICAEHPAAVTTRYFPKAAMFVELVGTQANRLMRPDAKTRPRHPARQHY